MKLQAFLSWWLSELAEMLPDRLRPAGGTVWTVEIRGDMLEAGRVGRSGWQKAGEAALADGEQVRRLVREAGNRPAILRLNPGQSLCRTVILPQAAEPQMRDAIAFQIDRYTPFRADDVFFGFTVAGRDSEGQTIQVELAVAPRKMVAGLVERLRGLGVETGHLAVDDIAIGQEAAARHATGRAVLVPLILAAILAVADIAAPLVRGWLELEELRAEMEEAKAKAVATAALRQDVDRQSRQLSFAAERRRVQPPMEEVLTELTRLVPDGTWATHLSIDGGTVQFTGTSNAANSLVTALEQSALFTRAAFRSPVTQDSATGSEQFHLSADLRARQP